MTSKPKASKAESQYDGPDAFYDGGMLYQDEPSPPEQEYIMNKHVKLNLAKTNVEQKISQGNTLHTGLTGNPNFSAPTPTMPTYAATIAGLTNTHAAYLSLKEQTKGALDARNAAEALYDDQTTQLAAYAEGASGGDAAKLEAAGFQTRKTPEPVGPLDEVVNLSVKQAKHEGTLKLKWAPVRGAVSYEVQLCPDPITSAGWQKLDPSSKSRCAITGLTAGTRVWVRVRAIGSSPPGPWSNPATRIVP